MMQLSEETIQNRAVRKACVAAIRPHFEAAEDASASEDFSFITRVVEYSATQPHIMEFTRVRVLEAMFALLRRGIENIIEYNDSQPGFPMEPQGVQNYMTKWLIFSCVWGIGGSMNLATRTDFSNKCAELTSIEMPAIGG